MHGGPSSGSRPRGSSSWWIRLAVAGLVISPLLVAAVTGFTVCPTAGLLGIPCPGCGLGRATLAALQGHFREAFAWHPLFFLVSPLYVGLIGLLLWQFVADRALPLRQIPDRWVTLSALVLGVLLITVWIARMLGALGGPVPVQRWLV
jgi:hypothetical protein